MPAPDALLIRVEKLLALATSSNLFEAAQAAAQAQALIEAHRLHELLAARAAGPGTPAAIESEALERARRPRKWRGVLAQGLAELNGCAVYAGVVGGETELRVVGRAEDRQAVRALFVGLAPRLEWLSATHGPGKDRAWHDAFRVGAAVELLARMRGLGAEPALPAEAALLRVDHDTRRAAVDAWVAAHLRVGRGRNLRVDAGGYADGQAAAATIELPAPAPQAGDLRTRRRR